MWLRFKKCEDRHFVVDTVIDFWVEMARVDNEVVDKLGSFSTEIFLMHRKVKILALGNAISFTTEHHIWMMLHRTVYNLIGTLKDLKYFWIMLSYFLWTVVHWKVFTRSLYLAILKSSVMLCEVCIHVFLNLVKTHCPLILMLKPIQRQMIAIFQVHLTHGRIISFRLKWVIRVVFIEDHHFDLEEGVDWDYYYNNNGNNASRQCIMIITFLIIVPCNMMTKHVLVLNCILNLLFNWH